MIKRGVSALGKLGIVVTIMAAFGAGLLGTIYYSLRSREVNVPNVVGKDVLEGEKALDHDGLNMRRRATRYSPNAKPNTILDQSPHAGEIIKVGQTVAVVISRSSAKEGEEGLPDSSGENSAAQENNTNADVSASNPANENSNKDKSNRNSRNRNTNNSNNANNANGNRNSKNDNANRNANNANNRNGRDRNANNANANSNRGTTNSKSNTNSGARNSNSGRSNSNAATNRRAPALSTPSTGQNRNRRVP